MGDHLIGRRARSTAAFAGLVFLLSAGNGLARKLATHEGLDAIVDDESVCRDPLPLTIRAATASAFTDRRADVERLIGGIRAILGFECTAQTVPQTFIITGEVEGRAVIHGSADASGVSYSDEGGEGAPQDVAKLEDERHDLVQELLKREEQRRWLGEERRAVEQILPKREEDRPATEQEARELEGDSRKAEQEVRRPENEVRKAGAVEAGRAAKASGDPVYARELFHQACEGGAAEGCSELGLMFYAGEGGPQDLVRAQELYGRVCTGGDAQGCFNLADIFRKGEDVPQDFVRARTLYEQACTGGNARGCSNLGLIFQRGLGGPQDQARARALYEHACTGGNAVACSNLASMLERGEGGGQDQEPARTLYERACAGGYAQGCINLGDMLRKGAGGPQDEIGARGLYDQAFKAGDAHGCSNLGLLLEQGRGGARDLLRAAELHDQACQAGFKKGCEDSDRISQLQQENKPEETGSIKEGIAAYKAKDYETASTKLMPVARAGNPAVQNIIAKMYHGGIGVTRDPVEAAKWFEKAAEQGHAEAQFELGVMLCDGEGIISQDLHDCEEWLSKAAAQGHEKAKTRLTVVKILKIDAEKNKLERERNTLTHERNALTCEGNALTSEYEQNQAKVCELAPTIFTLMIQINGGEDFDPSTDGHRIAGMSESCRASTFLTEGLSAYFIFRDLDRARELFEQSCNLDESFGCHFLV